MADESFEELTKQLGTPVEKHKEYDVERALHDVIRATEDGQAYVALAFLNGMLAAIKMGGKK